MPQDEELIPTVEEEGPSTAAVDVPTNDTNEVTDMQEGHVVNDVLPLNQPIPNVIDNVQGQTMPTELLKVQNEPVPLVPCKRAQTRQHTASFHLQKDAADVQGKTDLKSTSDNQLPAQNAELHVQEVLPQIPATSGINSCLFIFFRLGTGRYPNLLFIYLIREKFYFFFSFFFCQITNDFLLKTQKIIFFKFKHYVGVLYSLVIHNVFRIRKVLIIRDYVAKRGLLSGVSNTFSKNGVEVLFCVSVMRISLCYNSRVIIGDVYNDITKGKKREVYKNCP